MNNYKILSKDIENLTVLATLNKVELLVTLIYIIKNHVKIAVANGCFYKSLQKESKHTKYPKNKLDQIYEEQL